MDKHLPSSDAHAVESGAELSAKAAVLIDFASARAAARSDSSEPDLRRHLRVAGDNLQLLADMLECLAQFLSTDLAADPALQRHVEALTARGNLVFAACADAAARRARNQS